MQKLNLKGLKVIAICLAALLTICIAILLYRSPNPLEITEVENVDAINNNERIIHHSGDIYCYTRVSGKDNTQYMLLKLPIGFDENDNREVIETHNTSLDNLTLDGYKNKIFYRNGSTYFFDTVTNSIKEFCKGEIQFMIEPNYFVMLQDGNLYKGTYYATNYVVSSLEKLAEGDFIKVGEDNKRMYYYSSTGKNNIIVVGLDKKTLNIIIYDNIETLKYNLDDVIVTDNYLFEIYGTESEKHIKRISKKQNKEGQYLAEELKIDKLDVIEFVDARYTKPLIGNQSFDDVYFYGSTIISPGDYYANKVLDTKMYKYDSKLNKVSKYSGKLNELSTDRYSITCSDKGCRLLFDGKELTKVPTTIADLNSVTKKEVKEINIIEDYIYYEIALANVSGDVDVIFAQAPRNGGESRRINIPKDN